MLDAKKKGVLTRLYNQKIHKRTPMALFGGKKGAGAAKKAAAAGGGGAGAGGGADDADGGLEVSHPPLLAAMPDGPCILSVCVCVFQGAGVQKDAAPEDDDDNGEGGSVDKDEEEDEEEGTIGGMIKQTRGEKGLLAKAAKAKGGGGARGKGKAKAASGKGKAKAKGKAKDKPPGQVRDAGREGVEPPPTELNHTVVAHLLLLCVCVCVCVCVACPDVAQFLLQEVAAAGGGGCWLRGAGRLMD